MLKSFPFLIGVFLMGASLIGASALSGCTLFVPKTVVPLQTTEQQLGAARSDTLIILLPGMGDSDKSFFKNGFVDGFKRHGKQVDIIAANTHFGYYKEHSLLERLKTDVIEPATAKGYQHIWLAGISLGGLGSLIYSLAHPDNIDGVIVMAPYLGDKKLIEAINGYPSLKQWSDANRNTEDEIAQMLWLPLHDADCLKGKPVYLAVGEDDKFSKANKLLASRCGNIALLRTEGSHNWKTWKLLLDDVLSEVDEF